MNFKRLILQTILLINFYHFVHAQNCAYAGRDTLICGFNYQLIGLPTGGSWTYLCEGDKNPIVLDTSIRDSARIKVAVCGSYSFIYSVVSDSCISTDTVVIDFESTAFRLEEINFKLKLDYPVTNCQPSPIDSCGSIRVLQGIIPPLPNWIFNMYAKCEVISAHPTVFGNIDSTCLADSIHFDVSTKIISDSLDWTTSQNGFITLDNDKKITSNRFNAFFNFISTAILNELDVKCPLNKCFNQDLIVCTDTTVIDTYRLTIPVHQGGNWYLKTETGLKKLNYSNDVIIGGIPYFLYIPMGGDYYGPEPIQFELYSKNINNLPIPLKDKVGFNIVWQEQWIYDTIDFYQIREINQDKCFCNGTTYNYGTIAIPDVPEFNCPTTRLAFMPVLRPFIVGDDFLCEGSSLTLSADQDYKEFRWNNGETNKSTTYFGSGKVVLTVIDSFNCQGRDSIVISEIKKPELSLQVDKFIICEGECTNLNAVTLNINKVIWNVIDTVKSLRVCPVSDATYFVKVINPQGCITDSMVTIQVKNTPRPKVGKDLILNCVTKSVELNPVDSDLNPGRKFKWFGPGVNGINMDSLVIHVGLPGTYWFAVRDTFSNCAAADTIEVLIDTIKPSAKAGDDKILNCMNTIVKLIGDSSNTGAGYSLTWFGPGIDSLNRREINPDVSKSGLYRIQITDINNGCQSIDSVIVSSDFTKPLADAGPDKFLYCDSVVVTLEGSRSFTLPGDSIIWSGPGIDLNNKYVLRAAVSKPGKYQLILTNPNSHCSDTSEVIVSEPDTIANIILTKSADLGCQNDSVIISSKLSTGNSLRYAWRGPRGLLSLEGDSIIVRDSGKYYLFIYDSTTHCSDFDSITIFDTGGRPFVNGGPDKMITCEIANVILNGSVNIPLNNATIQWTGAGIAGGNNNVLQPSISVPGEYILKITDKRNNCSGIDTVYVSQNLKAPTLELGSNKTINCFNDTLNILAKIDDNKPTYDFRWMGPGVTSGNQRSNPLAIFVPGRYTASIITPNPVCSVFDTLYIDIDTLRMPLDLKDTLWFNCENRLINYKVGDFTTIDSVEWFDPLNRKTITKDSGRTIQLTQEGYQRYVVHYKNGCTLVKYFEVIPYAIIKIDTPIITASCTDTANGTFKIKVIDGNAPFSYSLDGSRPDSITYYTQLTPGSHKLRIFDQNGGNCFLDVFFDIPGLLSLPSDISGSEIEIEICKDTVLFGKPILDSLTQGRFPVDSVNYQWFRNGQTISKNSKDSVLIDTKSNYELRMTNKNGCGEIFINYNVDYKAFSNDSLVLPNVFTPDANMDNRFKPVTSFLSPKEFSLKIYNRWGVIVFETNDFSEAWDGTFKGESAPADTYWVLVQYKICETGPPLNYKRSLNLLR